MSNQPDISSIYHIAMFSFNGSKTAGEVFDQMKKSNAFAGNDLIAQAIVERDMDGQVHVHEPGAFGVGTTVGAIAGGVLGLMFSPLAVLVLATTGGAVGGITGHFAGRLIPVEDLKLLASMLPVNSSAFVALTEDTETEKIVDGMKGYNANVVTVTVGDELSGVIGEYIAGEVNLPPQESSKPAGGTAPAAGATASTPKSGTTTPPASGTAQPPASKPADK